MPHTRRQRLVRCALVLLPIALAAHVAGAQTANQPPVAATTGPYVSASRNVTFDGRPSADPDGDALTYAWDFGDGTTGTGAQPKKEYARRGVFTVTLVVTDARGAASAAASTTATIHFAPVAVVGGPYAGAEGSPVTFDGSGSSDRDGDALTYAWTFGDGTTGTGVRPVKSYAQSGTYTVRLVVTDARGAASPASSTTATLANVAPVVTATLGAATATTGATVTLAGTFTDPADGDGPWSYTVEWGDGTVNTTGSVATAATPIGATHFYATTDTFFVTLRVTDRDGGTGTATQQVTVTAPTGTVNRPPVAAVGGPYTGTEGTAVAFDGRGSADPDGDALTYAWNFGDGTTGTGAQPAKAYVQDGSYTVTLTVTDAQGAASEPATATVAVANVAPAVSATLTPATITTGGVVTLAGTFTDPGASDGPWSYTVEWGDGTPNATGSTAAPGSSINATHPYASTGTFTVTVRVTDAGGATGTAMQTLTVTPAVAAVTVLVAGDIADCARNTDEQTASILAAHPDAVVMTAGDNVYNGATLTNFMNCYDPSWGQHKARTWPVIGNHDYGSGAPKGEGYHAYFGARAGALGSAYYTTTFGDWDVYVLNSNISMKAGSPQEAWLRTELARSTRRCQMAVWHHPRFFSGTVSTERTVQRAVWNALYAAGVDLVVHGHEHYYERFAPQSAIAVLDPTHGIRQIIAGTGGKDFANFGTPAPNSEVRARAFGVLQLVLRADGYDWAFLPVPGTSFTDAGTAACHERPPA